MYAHSHTGHLLSVSAPAEPPLHFYYAANTQRGVLSKSEERLCHTFSSHFEKLNRCLFFISRGRFLLGWGWGRVKCHLGLSWHPCYISTWHWSPIFSSQKYCATWQVKVAHYTYIQILFIDFFLSLNPMEEIIIHPKFWSFHENWIYPTTLGSSSFKNANLLDLSAGRGMKRQSLFFVFVFVFSFLDLSVLRPPLKKTERKWKE